MTESWKLWRTDLEGRLIQFVESFCSMAPAIKERDRMAQIWKDDLESKYVVILNGGLVVPDAKEA